MGKFRIHLLVAFLLLACLFFINTEDNSASVKAQGQTIISINPADSIVDSGQTTVIEVKVANAIDLNAYDLMVIYDAEVLTLESWSHGGFLANPSVVYKEEPPGLFRLALTQLAAEGVSGDGILLNLTFKGEVTGFTNLEFQDVQLVNTTGQIIVPLKEHGTITVTEPAPATATSTHTLTPTETRTPTSTATFTITQSITLTHTSNPVITWTPTRTRTPTPVTGLTVTPIRAIVVTATGTPGTDVVVQPESPMEETTPSAQGTKPASGGIGGVPGTNPTQISPVTEADPGQDATAAGGNDLIGTQDYSEDLSSNSFNDAIERIRRSNNLMWGAGILIVFILAGLLLLFVNLWKKL